MALLPNGLIYSILSLSIKLSFDITRSNNESSLAPLALAGNATCCIRKCHRNVCRKLLLATRVLNLPVTLPASNLPVIYRKITGKLPVNYR